MKALRLIPLVVWLFAAGCTLVRPPAAPEAAAEARLRALDSWEARGRIAIRAEGGSGSGSLRWRQQPDEARIHVAGPFGAGAWDIYWSPWYVAVRSADGEVSAEETGPDAAERFLTRQLGWAFPVVSTRWWMLGLPDPGAPAETERDEAGRLIRLRQHGWNVQYEDFVVTDGLSLPRKFALESERGRLRVVIDRWLF